MDVANLTVLFSVPQHLRRWCMEGAGEAVLLHVGTRKHTCRGALMLMPEEQKSAKKRDDLLDDFISFK